MAFMSSNPKSDIHPKLWGEEVWIVNMPDYCGKILRLKKGFRCSIHYHRVKDETFHVTRGAVLMEIDGTVRLLTEGMTQRIPRGCKHRFTGIEESEMIEFSTHHDELDSYRETESGEVPRNEFKALRQKYWLNHD
jgi:quercetin dioxygenase-like cupin family protein